MYNKRCCKRLQTAACNEYTEKYSRGRRGAPAKGVGRLSRRESSNLSFSANAKAPNGCLFCVGGEGEIPYCAAACTASGAQITEHSRVGKLAFQQGGEGCSRGGSSQTSVVRSKRMLCILAPRGVEFKPHFFQTFLFSTFFALST